MKNTGETITYTYNEQWDVIAKNVNGLESVLDPATNTWTLRGATHQGSSPVPPEALTISISLVVKDGIVQQADYEIENMAVCANRICSDIRGMSIDEVKQWLGKQSPDAKASRKACASALANALRDV